MSMMENFYKFLHILQKIPVIYYTLLWLSIELLLCIIFMQNEPTYSFDWDAYMEQVHVYRTGYSAKTSIVNITSPPTVSSSTNNNDNLVISMYIPSPPISNITPVYQYDLLQGDTGPLAYPAGHLWIHNLFYTYLHWNSSYYTTEYEPKLIPGYELRIFRPDNLIYTLQFIYTILWLVTCIIIGLVYKQIGLLSQQYPFHIVLVYTIASFTRRTRNIFILGFFNDSWNTFFLWLSIYGFIKLYSKTIEYQYYQQILSNHKDYDQLFYKNFFPSFSTGFIGSSLFWLWTSISILYSFSVAIKMNSLLYAPGILFLYLDTWRYRSFTSSSSSSSSQSSIIAYIKNISSIQILFTLSQLFICGSIQIILAYPFLLTNWYSYFISAFNFSRQFELQWSITWNWVPLYIFSSKLFSVSLLIIHIGSLYWISNYWVKLVYATEFTISIPNVILFGNNNIINNSTTMKNPSHSTIDGSDTKSYPVTVDVENGSLIRNNISSIKSTIGDNNTNTSTTTTIARSNRRYSTHSIETIKLLESPRLDSSLSNTTNTNVSNLSLYSNTYITNDTTKGSYNTFTASFYSAKATYILCTSNIIGIICARSLHYQFLTWYWHSLVILLTNIYTCSSSSSTNSTVFPSNIGLGIPLIIQFFYVLTLELGWNHHPPDFSSSLIITFLHLLLYICLILQSSSNNLWYRILSSIGKFQFNLFRRLSNDKKM